MLRALHIVPLGGLGEVGRNLTVIEWGEERIVVDCGIGFPDGPRGDEDGVEQLLPDVAYLAGRPIAAVVLTHGHDDHIGALAHLIRSGAAIDRLVGLPFTVELVRAKLPDGVPLPRVTVATPGRVVTTGAFSIEFIRVAHSIPDSAALAIGTPIGTVVASGDYKLDTTAVNERRRTDKKRLQAIGRAGVLALLADSTNADEAGRTPSEDTTFEPIMDVVREAPGRVVLTSFASHVDRVDHALRAADETNRAVTFLGRSMRRNVEIAERLGELRPPRRETVPPRELEKLRARRSLVVSTGSQAERNAVLARAARDEHPQLVLSGADTVVFACRPVPGNEDAVAALIQAIRLHGARVVTNADRDIHVSGHARADEVEELITLLRPRFVIPIHGEPQMLEAQGRIAIARAGVDREHVLVAANGDVVELRRDAIGIVGRLDLRVVPADADGIPILV